MLEKLNTKTIVSKTAAYLFMIFFIFILPPPSTTFLFLSFGVAALTMLLMIISLKQRNARLYLAYHLGTFTIFFVFGLRFWSISIGLSLQMLICLVPGLVLASLLPYINWNISGRLHIAQWEMGSKNLLLLGIVGTANIVLVVVLWKLFGIVEIDRKLLMMPVVLGFLFYLIQLMGMQDGFHMYVSGHFQYRLNGENRGMVL